MDTSLHNEWNTGTTSSSRNYAGFWIRFVAFILDSLIAGILSFVLTFVLSMTMGFDREDLVTTLIINLFSLVFGWIYYAGLESSKYQGTLGKQMMGIYVTNESGAPISFMRATGRYFAKILSSIILLIGFIMAAFTSKKQALHDMIASTLVLQK